MNQILIKVILCINFKNNFNLYYKTSTNGDRISYFYYNINIMEDIPAGKLTQSTSEIPTPKKVFNPLGSESQWSLGWQKGSEKTIFNQPNNSKGFNNYHNQSTIVFGDPKGEWKDEGRQVDVKKKTNPVENTKPVWNYNPKTAGKTTLVLGEDKPDYRKKDQVNKIRTPSTLNQSRKK